MSYEWIKMRSDLWVNPKFLSLVNHLVYWNEDDNDPHGIFGYTCQPDAICTDVYPRNESNATVTDKALRIVTLAALRDVTMCALLRVWHAVNKFSKVVGEDAVCSPMCVLDLDAIAGFEGFGNAMLKVGWVEASEDCKSLTFKNFCEFNEPAILRKRPSKTTAERQADWRARQKQKDPAKDPVTSVTKSNARKEKIREEKNTTKTPPNPPQGVAPTEPEPDLPPPTPDPEPVTDLTTAEPMGPEGELAHAWTFTRAGTGWRVPNGETLPELLAFFREKIRIGKDPQRILTAIENPARDRTEKLWQFSRRELEEPAKGRAGEWKSTEQVMAEMMDTPEQRRALEIAFNGWNN